MRASSGECPRSLSRAGLRGRGLGDRRHPQQAQRLGSRLPQSRPAAAVAGDVLSGRASPYFTIRWW